MRIGRHFETDIIGRYQMKLAMIVACGTIFLSGQALAQSEDFSRAQLFNLEIRAPRVIEDGANLSLPLPFSFPGGARADSLFGVDVSHHNFDRCHCQVDWSKAAGQKVVFAYVKATQGDGFVDSSFRNNWAGLKGLAVHRGAYHFLTADKDPTAQAAHFVDVVRQAGGLKPGDMPPSLDIEWDIRFSGGKMVLDANGKPADAWSNVPAATILANMKTWLAYVEKELGRVPVIYTSRAWWDGRLGDRTLIGQFSRHKMWIADYSASGRGTEKPADFSTHPSALWQFTDSGVVREFTKDDADDFGADVSIFKGPMAEFTAAFDLK
jgi:lysozyme